MAMNDFENILEKISTNRSTPSAVSNDYKQGWYDGYQAAKNEQQMINYPAIPMPSLSTACRVCGINFGAGPMGYVCSMEGCPSKITASTVAGSDYTPMGGAGANGGVNY